jgi:AmmeMemoRadiSam system protein A
MTSDADRDRLLRLARDAIVAHVSGLPAPLPPLEGILARRGGAFVTLHSGGSLRGCIGHVEDDDPLGRVIPRCAVSAATQDPRFPVIEAAELSLVEIELSLLGPLEPVGGPSEIDIGRHGLVVERGWSRGLLLPQVATEWGWDVETFLAHTCRKAGLPDDSWKRGATLWRFEAEVFGEQGR